MGTIHLTYILSIYIGAFPSYSPHNLRKYDPTTNHSRHHLLISSFEDPSDQCYFLLKKITRSFNLVRLDHHP